jgi:hypothetical protein
MLICFFDIRSIVYFEFVPEGTIVNQTFFVNFLKKVIGAVRRKRGDLWRGRSLIFRHENAPAFSSFRVSQSLARKGISATDHSPHSPDLSPPDFWLFPKLKSMGGSRIGTVELQHPLLPLDIIDNI